MTSGLLVTKHHKLGLVAPSFAAIGWHVSELQADTDALGTFSGDVDRRHPPLETARRKALLAAGRPDVRWWFASEGTIGPSLGGLVSDRELVVAIEPRSGGMVAGAALSLAIVSIRLEVRWSTSEEEVVRACAGADLPRHHLVVSASDRSAAPVGALCDIDDVLDVIRQRRRRRRTLVLQPDLRSHLCPSRQPTIRAAAADLAARLATPCPACTRSGFGSIAPECGLPCAGCGQPTNEVSVRRRRCPWCMRVERKPVDQVTADAARCRWCNP